MRRYRLIALCHCAIEPRIGCAAGLARVRTNDGKVARELEIGGLTYRRSSAWTKGGAQIYEAVV